MRTCTRVDELRAGAENSSPLSAEPRPGEARRLLDICGGAIRPVPVIAIAMCALLIFQASCSTTDVAYREKQPFSTIEIARAVTASVVRLNVDGASASRVEPETPGNATSGTGVIVDTDGHIVTSLHVIGTPGEVFPGKVRATLTDGRAFNASLVGIDERLDLCVLKIDADGLIPAVFGDSTLLETGEDVITIGYSFDFAGPPSISSGIVSAIRRGFSQSGFVIPDAIQTDASIHPGNSGGPLVNRHGEVIGINVAVAAWTRDVGFALSSAVVRPAVESIIRNGSVRRSWLGLATDDITVSVPHASPPQKGIPVIMVMEGSPALKAGLQPDDIVVSLAGRKIENGRDLMPLLYMHTPGEDLVIEFYRQGRFMTGKVTLEERPAGNSSPAAEY